MTSNAPSNRLNDDQGGASASSGDVEVRATRPADWMFLQPSVMDEMHDAVITTDMDGVITGCNTVTQKTYGYGADEMIGQNVVMLYPEDERALLITRLIPAVLDDGVFRGEVRNQTSSGEVIDVDLRVALLRDAGGRPAGMVWFSVDITARKLGDLAILRNDAVERQALELERTAAALARSEAQVRKTSDRLASLLSTMSEGLVMLDPDWRYLYFSEQAERLTTIRAKDVLGKTIWEVFPHARSSSFFEMFHLAVNSGREVHFDEFYPEPVNKWLECACYPSSDGLVVYFRDITERQHAAESLRKSDERSRLGIQVATLALVEIDYGTGLSHLSADAAKMFGLGEEEVAVPREVVHATFDPRDLPELMRRIAGCLDPGGTGWFAMDHRVVWPNGSVHWLRVRKQVYFYGEGESRRPQRAMLAMFDVTAEKEASERVEASEAQFRTLTESLPQLIWTADADGAKVYCNHQYLDYTGLASLEMVGRQWVETLHPDDQLETRRLWTRSLETGEPYLAQYRLRRRDGQYRHFLAQALPIRNGDGVIERWLGSLTDVHDQKMAEDALRRSEMLAAAGKLAASVAHEINNPLASVTNLLYLLRTNPSLDDQARDFVVTAEEELERVTEITTQALRFHKQSLAPALTQISDLLDSVLAVYRSRIAAAGLTVVRQFRPAPPVTCRAADIRHLVSNMVWNALDATPPGGRLRMRLRVASDWKTGSGQGVRITIADTGRGVPRADWERIFEAFYSTKGVTGTGLGLWIAKDLIAKCGGRITLWSSTGSELKGRERTGSVFAVYLPLDRAGAVGSSQGGLV